MVEEITNPVYADDMLSEDESWCYLCRNPWSIHDMKEVEIDVLGNNQLICPNCMDSYEISL